MIVVKQRNPFWQQTKETTKGKKQFAIIVINDVMMARELFFIPRCVALKLYPLSNIFPSLQCIYIYIYIYYDRNSISEHYW